MRTEAIAGIGAKIAANFGRSAGRIAASFAGRIAGKGVESTARIAAAIGFIASPSPRASRRTARSFPDLRAPQ
jgi:hypothetical protein